jgi:hypothetical protein
MLTIIKQAASKLTSFGFDNDPRNAVATLVEDLSPTVFVYRIEGLTASDVYVLVIRKGHVPLEAHHVVDFRVGGNIYGSGI